MAKRRRRKRQSKSSSNPARLVIKLGSLQRACGPKPLKIHVWMLENKINIGLAMVAQNIVAMAGPLLDFYHELRSPKVRAKLPEQPDCGLWLSYYEGRAELWNKIAEKVLGAKRGEEAINAYAGMEFVVNNREKLMDAIARKKLRITRKHLVTAVRQAVRQYVFHLRELRADFTQNTSELRADFTRVLARTPELQFAVGVLLPCLICYRTSPKQLMLRAQLGNDKAIEQLIRLDGNVVYDSKIAAWIRVGKGMIREGRQQLVGQWLKEGIVGELSVYRFKRLIGGLVSFYGKGLAFRLNSDWTKFERFELTAPQIAKLFDAVAVDRKAAEPLTGKDRDIADCTPETWAKAVKRYRKIWEAGAGICPDKKNEN
jgi:hypothetical protein